MSRWCFSITRWPLCSVKCRRRLAMLTSRSSASRGLPISTSLFSRAATSTALSKAGGKYTRTSSSCSVMGRARRGAAGTREARPSRGMRHGTGFLRPRSLTPTRPGTASAAPTNSFSAMKRLASSRRRWPYSRYSRRLPGILASEAMAPMSLLAAAPADAAPAVAALPAPLPFLPLARALAALAAAFAVVRPTVLGVARPHTSCGWPPIMMRARGEPSYSGTSLVAVASRSRLRLPLPLLATSSASAGTRSGENRFTVLQPTPNWPSITPVSSRTTSTVTSTTPTVAGSWMLLQKYTSSSMETSVALPRPGFVSSRGLPLIQVLPKKARCPKWNRERRSRTNSLQSSRTMSAGRRNLTLARCRQ
mmetsp:Transcript_27527/g.95184  ORF Transcript_27527/g.95184 Transcript_27527/m.95184 type:complete len:364 (-) Transcript_27527:76-1167(-)